MALSHWCQDHSFYDFLELMEGKNMNEKEKAIEEGMKLASDVETVETFQLFPQADADVSAQECAIQTVEDIGEETEETKITE
jgi:hypothetical protein